MPQSTPQNRQPASLSVRETPLEQRVAKVGAIPRNELRAVVILYYQRAQKFLGQEGGTAEDYLLIGEEISDFIQSTYPGLKVGDIHLLFKYGWSGRLGDVYKVSVYAVCGWVKTYWNTYGRMAHPDRIEYLTGQRPKELAPARSKREDDPKEGEEYLYWLTVAQKAYKAYLEEPAAFSDTVMGKIVLAPRNVLRGLQKAHPRSLIIWKEEQKILDDLIDNGRLPSTLLDLAKKQNTDTAYFVKRIKEHLTYRTILRLFGELKADGRDSVFPQGSSEGPKVGA